MRGVPREHMCGRVAGRCGDPGRWSELQRAAHVQQPGVLLPCNPPHATTPQTKCGYPVAAPNTANLSLCSKQVSRAWPRQLGRLGEEHD